MGSERARIFTMLAGAASALGASASLFLAFENKLGSLDGKADPWLSLAIGTAAASIAAIVAVYMRLTLERERMRRKLRRTFIIYSKKDTEKAQEIADLLREANLDPWLDIEQIEAGQIWKDTLESALEESAMAVVLVTPNLTDDSFAMNELKLAIRKMESSDKVTSPIIPIRFEESQIPVAIQHIQYVDMSDAGAKDYLVRSLNGAMKRLIRLQPA